MKIKLDKLKSIFIINKQIVIFLLGLSIIAVIAGAFYITILNKTDHSLIEESISGFFNNINNNKLNYGLSFKNAILNNIGFKLVMNKYLYVLLISFIIIIIITTLLEVFMVPSLMKFIMSVIK